MLRICKILLSLAVVVSCATASQNKVFSGCILNGNCECTGENCNNYGNIQNDEMYETPLFDSKNLKENSGDEKIKNSEFYQLQQEYNYQQNSKEKNSEYKKQFPKKNTIEKQNSSNKVKLTKNYKQPVKTQPVKKQLKNNE